MTEPNRLSTVATLNSERDTVKQHNQSSVKPSSDNSSGQEATNMIKKGFTLVELMIVVLMLGALAAIAISRIMGCVEAGRDNACETNVNLINMHLEVYHEDTGSWPATLDDFLENTVYFPDGPPECPTLKKYELKTKKGEYRVKAHKKKDHRP